MASDDKKSFIRGAVILTMAAIFVKILSAVYRVPYQNIVGDVGFYIYQQVYPLYGIAVALSTYGFPVIISKLVAEKEGNHLHVGAITRLAFMMISGVGGVLFSITYFGAHTLAQYMGDTKLTTMIRIVAFSFLLMPFLAVWRGTFQGMGEMVPTAISQVVEQSVRVGAILLFSYMIIEKGYSLYVAGASAIASSLAGSLAGVLILSFFIRKHYSPIKFGTLKKMRSHQREMRMLIVQGTAICLSSMMLILLQLVDSLNLYNGLIQSGLGELEAKVAKGIYDRGQPLLQLGTVAAVSLSLTLVPLVTAAFQKNQRQEVRMYMKLATKVSVTIGLAATVGLINIMDAVNTMLFENSEGSFVLSTFCLSILFSSVILTFSGVLQSINKDIIPALAVVIGVFVKYIGNTLLVPLYETAGAAFSTVLALCVIALILAIFLRRQLKVPLIQVAFLYKALFAVSVMTVTLQIWRMGVLHLLPSYEIDRLQMSGLALSSVAIGAFTFIYTIIKMNLFTEEEWLQIPFGDKLKGFNRNKK
ncbi:polysaccharide biosynthesis protein [Bacillus sp. REN10]|uniref:putative polysaccharide biosynthesis protein n=1 Tax=Bacillus sp. REN10 TaxID=2782541 RepID=UPI001EEEDFEE|nr:polysaccharide biosynthesis protein [Bacillus sp. REN10]